MTCLAPYQEVLFGSVKKKKKKTFAADSLLQANKADDLY